MAKVTMPQLGESVAEGTIGKWLKKPGDAVAKYEPLLEVITDKVNAEVPSPFAGHPSRDPRRGGRDGSQQRRDRGDRDGRRGRHRRHHARSARCAGRGSGHVARGGRHPRPRRRRPLQPPRQPHRSPRTGRAAPSGPSGGRFGGAFNAGCGLDDGDRSGAAPMSAARSEMPQRAAASAVGAAPTGCRTGRPRWRLRVPERALPTPKAKPG